MELARIAYDAYSESLEGYIPSTSARLATFDELNEASLAAWEAAARAVADAVHREIETGVPSVDISPTAA